jgi:hypothetical protein
LRRAPRGLLALRLAFLPDQADVSRQHLPDGRRVLEALCPGLSGDLDAAAVAVDPVLAGAEYAEHHPRGQVSHSSTVHIAAQMPAVAAANSIALDIANLLYTGQLRRGLLGDDLADVRHDPTHQHLGIDQRRSWRLVCQPHDPAAELEDRDAALGDRLGLGPANIELIA